MGLRDLIGSMLGMEFEKFPRTLFEEGNLILDLGVDVISLGQIAGYALLLDPLDGKIEFAMEELEFVL